MSNAVRSRHHQGLVLHGLLERPRCPRRSAPGRARAAEPGPAQHELQYVMPHPFGPADMVSEVPRPRSTACGAGLPEVPARARQVPTTPAHAIIHAWSVSSESSARIRKLRRPIGGHMLP
jgi:hypothetical protein